jgi:hypothetical protein
MLNHVLILNYVVILFLLSGFLLFSFFFSSHSSVKSCYDSQLRGDSISSVRFSSSSFSFSFEFPFFSYFSLLSTLTSGLSSLNTKTISHHTTPYSDASSCDPYTSVDDSNNRSSLYIPCGLIARSTFNGIPFLFV